MISITDVRASKYFNCFKEHLSLDDHTLHSLAFILTSRDEDDLTVFKYTEHGVILDKDVGDYHGDICLNYLEVVTRYRPETIIEAGKKLWKLYSGYKVEFHEDEKRLLRDLGISKIQ
ncbi:MAG: hypothetical protein OWQ52_02055 [Metallosphaera prunae]|uniref:hypothetical protein n=1 Tax=Metallosphaera prunae TaxID=47304 RepID=UPI002275E17D|nr:hypothetical protein [Metallosphaera prunae]MCY0861190.1 hypothetical protein [Metallosphaera prunae]